MLKQHFNSLLTALVIILLGALWAPNFIPVFETADLRTAQFSESIAYSALFWILWFALFKKVWLSLMLATLPALWWAGSLFLRIKYQVPINQTFLSMILNTPVGEVFDFSLSYGWFWLAAATAMPISLLILSLYLIRCPLTWNHWSRYFIIIVVLSAGTIMYSVIDMSDLEEEKLIDQAQKDPFLAETPHLWLDRLGSLYPLDFPMAALQVYQNTQKTRLLRNTLPEIQVEKTSEYLERPDIVIIVIGESSRLNHWSLFGYSRQTSPLLQNQAGVLAFNNIVTQSVATRTAVPSIISRKPFLLPDGPAKKNIEPSILKAFEKVGYATYWLSNQSSSGFFENPVAFYAADAQQLMQLNSSSYSTLGTHDEIVIDKAKKILSNKKSSVMMVIHTMGSHFNYAHRYPPEFDKFQPSLNPRENLKRNGEGTEIDKIKNSYDNSILYTDFVINSLINIVRESSENSFLLYVSDHAEDIGDDIACSYTDIGRRSSNSFRVPMLIWLGSEYVRRHSVIANQLASQLQQPHISTVLPQTLLDMALVNVIGERSSSLLDLPYNNRIRRVFSAQGGWIDFDKAEQNNKCDIRFSK